MSRPILEPLLHAGSVKTPNANEPGERPWLILPAVGTIARLDSDAPARDRSEIYSSVIAVWFQDEFGMVRDERTLEQLRHLDWERWATDWSP